VLKLLFSVDYIRACALVIPSADAFFCGYYIVVAGGLVLKLLVKRTTCFLEKSVTNLSQKRGVLRDGVEASSEENHLQGLKYLEYVYNAKVM
jgi:hypothetical protein